MQALTEKSAYLLRIMFSEPAIMKELIDGKDLSFYSRIDIDPETGRIVLGKTRFKWWNNLTGDKKEISIEEFAFKTVGFLGNLGKQEGHGSKVTAELLEGISDSLCREGRSNDIIDRLFMVGYFVVKTTWSCSAMDALGVQQIDDKDVKVNLKVNERTERFSLPGSGDDFIEVTIGPKGVRFLD